MLLHRHSGAAARLNPESGDYLREIPGSRWRAPRNDETWRKPMPAAFFVVRATVSDPAQRAAFDAWYSKEHLPDAAKAFGVTKAWRFWSVSDPALHQATYQFADQAALHRILAGDAMKALVAEFDRAWPQVKRTREIFVLAEEYGTA
jgi:hypothetical protein